MDAPPDIVQSPATKWLAYIVIIISIIIIIVFTLAPDPMDVLPDIDRSTATKLAYFVMYVLYQCLDNRERSTVVVVITALVIITVISIIVSVSDRITGLLKIVCIDNNVFRLHYEVTTALLLVCCLLVTAIQFLGDPIDCDFDGINNRTMDTYCWIQPTFTVPSRTRGKKIGEEISYTGVATPDEGDELKYHNYYQWVASMLFLQAMLFYVPHYLWRIWEGGKCQMLVMDMQSPVVKEEKRRDRQKLLVDYFAVNLHHHTSYSMGFFCCEVLNFVNVVGQIFFTDLFLGYEFTTYGTRVIEYINMDPEDRTDPMALVFPKMTKCTFHKYGASGTVQRLDGLCVLPLNIINEKIYVFLWFWLLVLAALTGLALLYRLALLAFPQLRRQCLMIRARLWKSREAVATVARKCDFDDWFLLCQIGKNMDPNDFKEVIEQVKQRIES